MFCIYLQRVFNEMYNIATITKNNGNDLEEIFSEYWFGMFLFVWNSFEKAVFQYDVEV